jgi:peptide/nickel transport system permease protein
MGRFIIRRIFSMALVLFAISVLTFVIFQKIPNGDPALRLAGRTSTPEQIAAIRRQWHFNDPIYSQYLSTMGKIFTGKVISYQQQLNVWSQIRAGIPRTFALAIGAAVIWMTVAVLFGLFSAIKAGRFADRGLTAMSMVGVSTPVFFLGAISLYFFAYKIQIFPNTGYVPFAQSPWGWFSHLLLPWLVLAVLFIGVYSRVLRGTILDTINDDYVRTARAKGLSERDVLVRHVLRNSLIPIVSLFGLDFAALIGGGAILTENVFNINGVGQYAYNSVQQLDVPPVMVITMFTAFFVVFFSAVVDIAYAYLDPRIRLTG